jgi:predicted permease
MAPAGLLQPFLGAVQASLSVLLVMFYGGIAAHFKLIDRANTKPISKLCVRMLLPALLITKVGSELKLESAHRYLVILIWGVVCHVISFLIGIAANIGLGMPDWATVAILVNNTTSYPLLLITALENTRVLDSLIVTDETTKDAIERAKSYFLVFSTLSNCITFAVGPRLIDSENAPEDDDDSSSEDSASSPDVEANEESRLLGSHPSNSRPSLHPLRSNSFITQHLRQDRPKPEPKPDHRRPWFVPHRRWKQLSPRAKWWLLFVVDFFNAPILGAIIGAILGLVPVFHRAFFNPTNEGGIFTAWLTESLKSIGELFVALPVLVAGVSLFCSTKEAKDNNESVVSMPWGTVSFILFVRFIAWPVVSISVIYALAVKTNLLGSDPILWFTLMMMPAGPSAMKLITLVQVAEGCKEDERHISRLLTVGQPPVIYV